MEKNDGGDDAGREEDQKGDDEDESDELFPRFESLKNTYFCKKWQSLFLFLNWANPGLFLIVFSRFNQHYTILQQINLKNVHQVPGFKLTTFWLSVSSLNH